jgi:hypothetical protein
MSSFLQQAAGESRFNPDKNKEVKILRFAQLNGSVGSRQVRVATDFAGEFTAPAALSARVIVVSEIGLFSRSGRSI